MKSRKNSVLVVDDLKDNRKMLSGLLKAEGYFVDQAIDGGQALAKLENRSFDLVLLRIHMPGIDGIHVLEQLKADSRLCGIPVIVLAAENELDSIIQCLELGAIDFMAQPFNKVMLNTRVTTSLERKWLHDHEIRLSNEFMRSILESLSHPLFVINVDDYTIELANSAASSGKSLAGLTCYELIHGTDSPCSGQKLSCPLETVRKTKKSVIERHVHYDINGNQRLVEIHAHPIMSCDGEVSQMIEYNMDITDRFQMKDRLNAIYELGQELIMIRDEDTIIHRVMEKASSLIQSGFISFGLVDQAASELVCRQGFIDGVLTEIDIHLPLEQSDPAPVCLATVHEKQIHYVPDISQDPRYIPLPGYETVSSILCVPVVYGERILGVLNVKDTSPYSFTADDQQLLQTLSNQTAVALENTHLYSEMERQTNHLSTLLDASQNMTSSLDMDTVLDSLINRIRDFFDADGVSALLHQPGSDELLFVAVCGFFADQLKGQRFPASAGIAGWAYKSKELVVENDVQQNSRFYTDIDNQTGITTLSLIAIPLIYRDSAVGVIEIVNPDAEMLNKLNLETVRGIANSASIAIKNAELYRDLQNQMKSLKNAQEQLIRGEKMSALGRLVASIAHEINNPLQSIQTYVTLAKENIESFMEESEPQRYLDIVESEIERIVNIVRSMRDFYRSSEEGMQLIDLHVVLDSVLTLSGKQLQSSNVIVEREWFPELPLITASSDHLKQIFLNLVLNAVDSMPSGGKLCIRTELDTIQKENEKQSRPAVRVEFSDVGEGIPPEVLSFLFEPFFTTKKSGTGLGLSIVYNIIEAHHGQISVESEVGEGTTFRILLPVTTVSPTNASPGENTQASINPGELE